MFHRIVFAWLLAAGITLAAGGIAPGVRAQSPSLTLSLDAPPDGQGEAKAIVEFQATARLTTQILDSVKGVEAWQIAIAGENCSITDATVSGTSGALTADGSSRLGDGFEKTEITTGAGNEGVVSAVALSSGALASLAPAGT